MFLAKCYHKQGEGRKARDHYQQALHRWNVEPLDDCLWQKILKEIQGEVALLLGIKDSTIDQDKVPEKNPDTK